VHEAGEQGVGCGERVQQFHALTDHRRREAVQGWYPGITKTACIETRNHGALTPPAFNFQNECESNFRNSSAPPALSVSNSTAQSSGGGRPHAIAE
jgi:hypothetical protein